MDFLIGWIGQVIKIMSQQEQVFEFAGGTHCDLKISLEFRVTILAAPLCNVGGNGNRRALRFVVVPSMGIR